MEYIVREAHTRPQLDGDWDGPAWWAANCEEVAQFRPEGSDHRPHTQVKLLYDSSALYGMFRVEDTYVSWGSTDYINDDTIFPSVQVNRSLVWLSGTCNGDGVAKPRHTEWVHKA